MRLAALLVMFLFLSAAAHAAGDQFKTIESKFSVKETLDRLTEQFVKNDFNIRALLVEIAVVVATHENPEAKASE